MSASVLSMAYPIHEGEMQLERMDMLAVREISASYGQVKVLHGINLEIATGETVALVGANGAGKSTLLRCIQGLHPTEGGTICFSGRDITRLPAARRVALGICQSPEGRQVFGTMTVEDNLLLGGYVHPKAESARQMERMYEMFPALAERRRAIAGMLSGGQQQILTIARALMGKPRLLLLDEPSMGLAPLMVEEIFRIISELARSNTTILLVEQNAQEALTIAHRGYVIEAGRIIHSGAAMELLRSDKVRSAYLGQ